MVEGPHVGASSCNLFSNKLRYVTAVIKHLPGSGIKDQVGDNISLPYSLFLFYSLLK